MSGTERIYTILIVTDYETAKASRRTFIDSIRNNLLRKDWTDADRGKWVNLHMTEYIRVSIVDVVDTVEKAKNALMNSKYDAVICDGKVGGNNIGKGTLDTFRKLNNSATYILLLHPTQKKGAIYTNGDGQRCVCEGKKVQSLFDGGYYNAIYQNEINMNLIARMIKAGGMTEEWALEYYGLLPSGPAALPGHVGQPSSASVSDESESSVPSAQAQTTINAVLEDASRKESNPKESRGKKGGLFGRGNHKSSSETKKPVEDTLTQPLEEPVIPEQPSLDTITQSLSTPMDEPTSYEFSTESVQPTTPKQSLVEQLPMAAKKNSSIMGSFNAVVSFAQDNTVILKLDKPLSDLGLDVINIVGMPVVIPYLNNLEV